MSLPELTYALTEMRKRHHIECSRPNIKAGDPNTKIRVINHVKLAQPKRLNLILETRAFFELSNIKVMPLELAVKADFHIKPEVYKVDLLDYVDIVAKPSVLGEVLTATYKVNPYDVRKESVRAITLYIAGVKSKAATKKSLTLSLSQRPLLDLLESTDIYREAFSRLKNESVEEVALEYGLPEFDLNYLVSTYERECNIPRPSR